MSQSGGWAGLPGVRAALLSFSALSKATILSSWSPRSSLKQRDDTLTVLPRQPLRWPEKPWRGRVPEDGGDGFPPGGYDRLRGVQRPAAPAVSCSCSHKSRSGREGNWAQTSMGGAVITIRHWVRGAWDPSPHVKFATSFTSREGN